MISVPFVPTPEKVAHEMLRLAGVGEDDIVFDLGCGDGCIVITAAKDFGARAVGIEIRRDLVLRCYENILKNGVEDRVIAVEGDFFEINLEQATVVTLYLLTSVNERLRPKLEKELRPGTRVVSHDFEVLGWRPKKVIEVKDSWRSHRIYLYER